MSQQLMTQARECCIQFLYQCEINKIFYFSLPHFQSFLQDEGIDSEIAKKAQVFLEGVFSQQNEIDTQLRQHSIKWTLERMAAMDRASLRLATYELLATDTPYKVILNEAIEIAKRYGTENSSAFVNGVLDSIASKLKQHGKKSPLPES